MMSPFPFAVKNTIAMALWSLLFMMEITLDISILNNWEFNCVYFLVENVRHWDMSHLHSRLRAVWIFLRYFQ